MTDALEQVVGAYFSAVRDVHRLGAGTKERSYYPALSRLLADIGRLLKPKVLCLSDLGNTGAGHPDFGLFAANQVQKGVPRKGQSPERGVIEVKGVQDDAWLTAKTTQVSKYFGAYRLVIVSNIRDFLIIGEGPNGQPLRLESFRLATDAASFWKLVETPQRAAKQVGKAFGEYLKRALTQSVALREPKDVAWFLASYARDALSRVEDAGDLPALQTVRVALEEALGVTFDTQQGRHFFHSTLVQTLFYGVFSAWVLWAREVPRSSSRFEWEKAIWHLNVPFVRELFRQLSDPKRLKELGLVEVLNWTAATLNRIDTTEFFKRFKDSEAVQYFYEPFLEAFDPELRKELGVWYTPSEVVTYMVERVDKALRDDLGVVDGLASDQVIVLDPCCGTGTYLASVLRKIDASLAAKGFGDLRGQKVKEAAMSRVFGFEIMPAPLVVAHLQVGLALQAMNAALDADSERPGIFLTNALTGWEPTVDKPLPFPELEEERKKADQVKQHAPILVILGNPPYNGYAGVAVAEERELSNAYRTVQRVRRPEGQGLNDLYIRFFRMAERRIAEKTGRGVICFISNYSWLTGLSSTGVRERLMEAFDAIRIDCLNGDKYKTGKTTPDGAPDPSIFSTEHNREGIQVGTAIATLIRKAQHSASTWVDLRQLWGTDKRQQLLKSADSSIKTTYTPVTPRLELGLPFADVGVSKNYFLWPSLPELLPVSFPGVKTSRDEFLVAIDRDGLEKRLATYFGSDVSHDNIRALHPSIMTATDRFEDPPDVRDALRKRGFLKSNIVRYAYRPFDIRWVYWEPETKLLDEKREDYFKARLPSSLEMITPLAHRKQWSPPLVFESLLDLNAMDGGASSLPMRTRASLKGGKPVLNIPASLSKAFATELGKNEGIVFDHCLAILHSPSYFSENNEAMRLEPPHIPIPGNPKLLCASAELGSNVALLLNPESSVSEVTTGTLRPLMAAIGVATTRGNKAFDESLRSLNAGWGYFQTDNKTGGKKTMPAQGMAKERPYTNAELTALSEEAKRLKLTPDVLRQLLGNTTFDVHLNDDAWWSNVPSNVWIYSLGGYPVIKKWLSYREHKVLGRALKVDEIVHLSQTIRRIATLLLMGPALDTNYVIAKANASIWKAESVVEVKAPT